MKSDYRNSLLLDMLTQKPCQRYPVWVMRQAGRVLKEYREVRKKAGSFIQLVKNPKLAAEVTLQPVDILGVDAAIIFSDILVVPEAMGFSYIMEEVRGPSFPKTIRSKKDADQLEICDVNQRLDYVLEAIRITCEKLDKSVPLIGFAGAPLTIFSYLVEGKGSKTFSEARKLLYTSPELCHAVLQKITTVTIAYLKAQVKAGAAVVQVFDSWAGIYEPEQYETFGVQYLEQISHELSPLVPVIVFPKGAWHAYPVLSGGTCAAVGIDWNIRMQHARAACGNRVVLQGNLDPAALYASVSEVKDVTLKMLKGFAGNRHIANLGHGVYPDTEPDKLKCFIQTIKEFKIENNS